MWKWIILIALLAVVAVFGTAGMVLATSGGARQWLKTKFIPEPQIEVRLSSVVRGDLVKTVNAPGSVEPKTKVQISAQVVARITALPFREGEAVKSGDVVVRLDSRDLAAQVESAQANLKAEEARLVGAQAQFEQNSRDLERLRSLFTTRDVSQSQVDDAATNQTRALSTLEATKQAIAGARATIVRAQKDLENTVISAPFNGMIVKLNAEVGELVLVGTLNNAASVIMEIADLSVMIMKARVDEANIAPVKANQVATVYINAYNQRPFSARVERVGLKRQIDRDGTGYFEVEVLVDKPKDIMLASGLTANADISVQTYTGVLKVPTQAVVDRRVDSLPAGVIENPLVDKSKLFARVAFIIENGKAKAVPVSTGTSDLTDTILTAGLDEGAQIITGPYKVLVDLADGATVIEEGKLPKKKVGLTPAKAGNGSHSDNAANAS